VFDLTLPLDQVSEGYRDARAPRHQGATAAVSDRRSYSRGGRLTMRVRGAFPFGHPFMPRLVAQKNPNLDRAPVSFGYWVGLALVPAGRLNLLVMVVVKFIAI
jgi:hypothetical protein